MCRECGNIDRSDLIMYSIRNELMMITIYTENALSCHQKDFIIGIENRISEPSLKIMYMVLVLKQNKLRGLGPRAKYTDRATAACQRSDCQLLRIEGATWSA
jgi:hypothetical protein